MNVHSAPRCSVASKANVGTMSNSEVTKYAVSSDLALKARDSDCPAPALSSSVPVLNKNTKERSLAKKSSGHARTGTVLMVRLPPVETSLNPRLEESQDYQNHQELARFIGGSYLLQETLFGELVKLWIVALDVFVQLAPLRSALCRHHHIPLPVHPPRYQQHCRQLCSFASPHLLLLPWLSWPNLPQPRHRFWAFRSSPFLSTWNSALLMIWNSFLNVLLMPS